MDGRNSQRKVSGKSSRVDAEVARLLSKPSVSKQEFMRLRNKMDDGALVDQIQTAYLEKYELVEKRAKAFARKILEKYGVTNQPFSQLVLKAHKYANKYNLSDAEKTAFTRILQQELAGADRPDVPKVTTNMSKVLGDITIDTQGFGMKVSDADYKELQEILRMRDETKPLHSQVILQSLSYNDCDTVATSGKFIPESGHNLACHVHPVIAALFLPKFTEVEHHFLYSNLANIVASRYNQQPFKTKPDYELFYNLVTDPNDVVCDSRSPLKDLKNRCHLQKQLWQSVLGLRNGQYYNCDQLDLMKAIDMCRLNKYDTPDLVYGRYDGTVIKRLFAAFSFRPTLVLSAPTPSVVSHNPYFQTGAPTVSTISMINLRLPQFSGKFLNPAGQGASNASLVSNGPISLSSALSQSQLFFENGTLLMKNTQVIDTRGILVFFVDRRQHSINFSNYMDPIGMVALPSAISGFERVNKTAITVDAIKIGDASRTTRVGERSPDDEKVMTLVSVVCANTRNVPDRDGNQTSSSNKNLFVGSKALVRDCFKNPEGGAVLEYNPMQARRDAHTMKEWNNNLQEHKDVTETGMIFVFSKGDRTFGSPDPRRNVPAPSTGAPTGPVPAAGAAASSGPGGQRATR